MSRYSPVASLATRVLILFGAFSLSQGCVGDESALESDPGDVAPRDEPKDLPQGKSLDLKGLPKIDAIQASEVFVQKLPQLTAAGENVAVHIKLPPPANKELTASLVRVVGDPERPMVLFRSDTLVELGKLKESPGKEFFTTFAFLSDAELKQRAAVEAGMAKSKTADKQQIKFTGRTPIGISTGVAFDIDRFNGGRPVRLGACPIQPLSEQARWDEALVVTDLDVVRDSHRTNDICDGGPDNPDGVWTFKHLMTEMATGSGLSTHDFVVDWLSNWLTPAVVNGDTLAARDNMYHQVIRPWADVSGVSSSLSSGGVLTLIGELDLDRAPFRLSAIVNRIDLGATASGPAGYGGASTSQPTTAGEMRFVFGVQDLDSCSVLPFSLILEYGVPVAGCSAVKAWAKKWIKLSDPSLPRFGPAWRQQLEDITESVVVAGAAPTRGNKNAINQVRTNERGLALPWQFREFTLSTEDPVTDIDTPANGPLRAHTVAMTPDDTEYDPFSDPRIDDFVLFAPGIGAAAGVVRSAVSSAVSSFTAVTGHEVLTDCAPSYSVPQLFNGDEFRGGDAFTANPTHWRVAAADPSDLRDVCAREQFSVNTCNGCHFSDTSTSFFHVDPTASPAALSNFMTGGAGVWSVPDAQWPAIYDMQFRDLDRRHNRLYEIACAQCGSVFDHADAVLEVFVKEIGVVPVDAVDPLDPLVKDPKFKIGPVLEINQVKLLLSATAALAKESAQELELGKLVRPRETFVH